MPTVSKKSAARRRKRQSAVSVQPDSPGKQPIADSQQPPDDIEAITKAICAVLADAVALIECLPALKRVAQVIDECACPPDPAKCPPDWCMIVTAHVQRELEYAIRCVNHSIRERLQQVAIIMRLDPGELPHTSSCE